MLPLPLISALRSATRIVVLTGAGVSAESGIPTSATSKPVSGNTTTPWNSPPPMRLRAIPPSSGDGMNGAEPRYCAQRPTPRITPLHNSRRRRPNLRWSPKMSTISTNVPVAKILHLHGEINRPYCERCHQRHTLPTAIPQLPADGARLEPPRCASCSGTIRPGVVWFGEALPSTACRRSNSRRRSSPVNRGWPKWKPVIQRSRSTCWSSPFSPSALPTRNSQPSSGGGSGRGTDDNRHES